MINLKWIIILSSYTSIKDKFLALFSRPVFQAVDMQDYLENARYLPKPFYKRSPYAAVCINNVNLSLVEGNNRDFYKFLVSDDTGQELMQWNEFESLGRKKGISENDFVHALFLRYYTRERYAEIILATKNPPNRTWRRKSKKSLLDKIKDFFPEEQPIPLRAV